MFVHKHANVRLRVRKHDFVGRHAVRRRCHRQQCDVGVRHAAHEPRQRPQALLFHALQLPGQLRQPRVPGVPGVHQPVGVVSNFTFSGGHLNHANEL